MKFWLRNIILIVILAALAYLFYLNKDLLLSFDEQVMVDDTAITEDGVSPKKKKKKSTNAAAEGLSRFYASINPSMNKKGPKIKNNVVYLPEPQGDLINILEARRMVTRPYRKNWRGSIQSRPFRQGETLFQKLSEFASQEGLELIWWLNRDFIVKDPFRINKNILATSFQVGKAVEGHFQNGMSIYFCYQHRALVMIEDTHDYLNRECQPLRSRKDFK